MRIIANITLAVALVACAAPPQHAKLGQPLRTSAAQPAALPKSEPVVVHDAGAPSATQALESGESETVVRGATVIATIRSNGKPPGSFEVIPFDDRIWIAACSPNPFGCARPQIRELEGNRWLKPIVGLQGLPQLGAVNLYALTDLPFKQWVSHEENPPFDDPHGQCIYANFMLGSRDIAGAKGTFPDRAWLVVRASLSHSGLPVDDLYHWHHDQWRRVLHAKAYGDTIVDGVPWGNGFAVARRQGDWEAFRYDLLYVTDESQQSLLSGEPTETLLTVDNGALIAVTGAYLVSRVGPITNLRLKRWSTPQSIAQTRDIPVAPAEDSTSFDVKLDSHLEVTWAEPISDPKLTKKLIVELDGDFRSRTETSPFVSSHESGTLIALPPPYDGEALAMQSWHIRGRNFWLVAVDKPESMYLLLSNKPAPIWMATPNKVSEPRISECESVPRFHRRGRASMLMGD